MAAKSDRDSDSILLILFFFQREMERRKRKARWKSRRIRTKRLSHRRQNEEEDKEDEEVDTTAVPCAECVEKKEGFYYSPAWTFFSPKNSQFECSNITKKPKISSHERTERDQKHEKERELSFLRFFIHTACSTKMFVVFTTTRYFTRALTLALLFKYTHTFIKKCCSLPRGTSLNRFYYGGASFSSAAVGDDDPAERVAS